MVIVIAEGCSLLMVEVKSTGWLGKVVTDVFKTFTLHNPPLFHLSFISMISNNATFPYTYSRNSSIQVNIILGEWVGV